MQSFSVYKRKKNRRRRDTKWIVAWTDETGKRRAKAAFTDYEASVELARKLVKKVAMISVGLTDPFEDHRKTHITKHLADFIAGLKTAKRSSRYIMQVESRIKRIISGLEIKHLHELDPVVVDRFLTDLAAKENLSGITRNEYIVSIKALTKWAVTFRRLGDDPLGGLRVTERRGIEPAHPRRALTMAEVARLLDAAERRPLIELQTIRIGPNAGKPLGKVRPETAARANRKGKERRLVYLLGVWTGLRRSEIRQLTWGDIHLDCLPGKIVLRANTTKSKRADSLPIHPQLADELRRWKPAGATPSDNIVSTVPNMKVLRADLAFGNIPYKDSAGRYVDFHSLRVSLSTMLAANKVSPRAAQALMRHTDPRLTASVYTDEKLLPLAAELQSVPDIALNNHEPSDTETSALESIVANLSADDKQTLLEMLRQTRVG